MHPQAECQHSKLGWVEQMHGRVWRSISQLLLGPHAPNIFWKFLRHIGTFLDYLGGVDTPVGRVPVPKTRPSWANTFGVGRSISQLLLGSHAPNTFWRFLRHIGIFLDHLGGVDTPIGRVSALKTGLRWANTWGSGEVSISASIRVPCTKYFLEVPETHKNISRLLEKCLPTYG